MAKMTIRVTNASFESISSDDDFDTVEDAYQAALKAGVQIAAEEVVKGAPSVIVEIAVDVVGQRNAARGAVSMAAAPLLNYSPDA